MLRNRGWYSQLESLQGARQGTSVAEQRRCKTDRFKLPLRELASTVCG